MFDPLQYTLGAVWGAIKAPFVWAFSGFWAGLNGALTGGAIGLGASVAVQLLGGPVLAFIEGLAPSLGGAAWFEAARHYVASTTWVEKLALFTPVAAAAGAGLGVASAIPRAISENQQTVPEFTSDVTKEKVTVNGWERGQNHGVTAGVLLAAGAAAMVGVGMAKKYGYIGDGEETSTPVPPPPTAKTDPVAPER